jgi:pimeloyl-ACP methyl ester carboxylesterase
MTVPSTGVENEFADLPPDRAVERRWVNVITGGHISGVVWGTGPPELVLLHDTGGSARSWDGLLLALDRPAIALDLPGHGRSNDGSPGPRPVLEALRSFAPGHRVLAGKGLGALVAVAAAARAPAVVHRLGLIDTVPDERYWAALAALAVPPTLIRSEPGAVSGEALDRIRREVPAIRVVTNSDLSAALTEELDS